MDATDKADELYRALIAVTESWAGVDLQPLLATEERYINFLIGQRRLSAFICGQLFKELAGIPR